MVRALSDENERLKDTVDFLLNRLDEREPRAVGVQGEAGNQRHKAGKRGVPSRGDQGKGHGLRAKRKAVRPPNN
mgnify:CR=1 FL=1